MVKPILNAECLLTHLNDVVEPPKVRTPTVRQRGYSQSVISDRPPKQLFDQLALPTTTPTPLSFDNPPWVRYKLKVIATTPSPRFKQDA